MYYNKDISQLDGEEELRLISILPNPRRFHPEQSLKEAGLANRYYLMKIREYLFKQFVK